jgi:hypothetical protein
MVVDPISNDPLTIDEAKSRPNWSEWKKAMDDEMDQLHQLGTFSYAPLPKDRTAVACKWVFCVKCDTDGTITHYKAWLVAKGFSQIPGIDYDETFAPVVRCQQWPLGRLNSEQPSENPNQDKPDRR